VSTTEFHKGGNFVARILNIDIKRFVKSLLTV
jgi:hypothetical protein